MNNFIYNTPTKIFFGKNEEDKLGQILNNYKVKKVLLHYGTSSIKKIVDFIWGEQEDSQEEYEEKAGRIC